VPTDLQRWAAVQLQRIRQTEGEVPYMTALRRAQHDPAYTQELAGVAEHGKLMQGMYSWPLEVGLGGAAVGASLLGIPGVQLPVGLGLAGLGAARIHEAYKRKQEDLPWKMEMGIGAIDPLMLGWQGYKALKKPAQAAASKITDAFRPQAQEGPLQNLQEQVTANLGPQSAALDANLLRPLIRQEGDQAILRARVDPTTPPQPITPSQDPSRYDLGRTGPAIDTTRLPSDVETTLRKDVGKAFPRTNLTSGEIKVPTQGDYPAVGTVGAYQVPSDPMLSAGRGVDYLEDAQRTWKSGYTQIPHQVIHAREKLAQIQEQTLRQGTRWEQAPPTDPGHPLNRATTELHRQVDEAYHYDPHHQWPPQMGPEGQEPIQIPNGAWKNRKTGEVWSDPEGRLAPEDAAGFRNGPHRWAGLEGPRRHPIAADPAIKAEELAAESRRLAESQRLEAATQPTLPGIPPAGTVIPDPGSGVYRVRPQGDFEGRGPRGGPVESMVGRWAGGPGGPEGTTPYMPSRVRTRKISEVGARSLQRKIDRDIKAVNQFQGLMDEMTAGGAQLDKAALARIPVLLSRLRENVAKLQMLEDIPANKKYKDWLSSRGVDPDLTLGGKGLRQWPAGRSPQQPVDIEGKLLKQGELTLVDSPPTKPPSSSPQSRPTDTPPRDAPADHILRSLSNKDGSAIHINGLSMRALRQVQARLESTVKRGQQARAGLGDFGGPEIQQDLKAVNDRIDYLSKEAPTPQEGPAYNVEGEEGVLTAGGQPFLQGFAVEPKTGQVVSSAQLYFKDKNTLPEEIVQWIARHEPASNDPRIPQETREFMKKGVGAAKRELAKRGHPDYPFDEYAMPGERVHQAPDPTPFVDSKKRPVSDAQLAKAAHEDVNNLSRGKQERRAAPLSNARLGQRVEYYARLIQRHMFDPMLATFLTKRGGQSLIDAFNRLGKGGALAPDDVGDAFAWIPEYAKTPEGRQWFTQHYGELNRRLRNDRTLREIVRRTLIPYTPEGRNLWQQLMGAAQQGSAVFRTPGNRRSALRYDLNMPPNITEDLLRHEAEMNQGWEALVNPTGHRAAGVFDEIRDISTDLADENPELRDSFDRLTSALASENMEMFHPKLPQMDHFQALFPDQKAWMLDALSAFRVDDLGGGISEDHIVQRLMTLLNEPVEALSKRIAKEAQAQHNLGKAARQQNVGPTVRQQRLDFAEPPSGVYGSAPEVGVGRSSAEIAKAYSDALGQLKSTRSMDAVQKAITIISRQRSYDAAGSEVPGAAGILRYLDSLDLPPDVPEVDALFASMEDVLKSLTGVAQRGLLDEMAPKEVGDFIRKALKEGRVKGRTLQMLNRVGGEGPSIPYDQMAQVYQHAVKAAKQPAKVGRGHKAYARTGQAALEVPLTDPIAARRLAIFLIARQTGLSNQQLASLSVGDFTAHTLGAKNSILSRGVLSVGGRKKGKQPPIQGAGDYHLNNDTHDAILLMLANRYGWKRSGGGAATRKTHRLNISGENDHHPLFASLEGKELSSAQFLSDINNLVAAARVKPWKSPFQSGFRRWAADHAGSPEMKPEERLELARIILGHSDTATTKKFYTQKGPVGEGSARYSHGLNAAEAKGIDMLRRQEGGVPDEIVAAADNWFDTRPSPQHGPWAERRSAEGRQAATAWKGQKIPLTQQLGGQPHLTAPLLADPKSVRALSVGGTTREGKAIPLPGEQPGGGFFRLLPLGARLQQKLGGLPLGGVDPASGVPGPMSMFRGERTVRESMEAQLHVRYQEGDSAIPSEFGDLDPGSPPYNELVTKELRKVGIGADEMITLGDGSKIRPGVYGDQPEVPRFPEIARTAGRGKEEAARYDWADADAATSFFDELDAGLRKVDDAVLREPVDKITETFASIRANANLTREQEALFSTAVHAFWSKQGRNIRNLALDALVLGDELARTAKGFASVFGEALQSRAMPGSAAISGNVKAAQQVRFPIEEGEFIVSQGFTPAIAEMRMEGINLVEDYVRAVLGKVDAGLLPVKGLKGSEKLLPQAEHFAIPGLMHHEPYLLHAMGTARNRRLWLRMDVPGRKGGPPQRRDNYGAIRRLLYSIVPMTVLPHAAAEYLGVGGEEL
jgi:hypothetical protein